jgi:hypothetical protein
LADPGDPVSWDMLDWIEDEVHQTLRRHVSKDLDTDEDLFDASATSVQLLRALAELTESTGCVLEPEQLVTHSTSRQIANLIREARSGDAVSGAVSFRPGCAESTYVLLLCDCWDLIHARDVFHNLEGAGGLLVAPFLDYSVAQPWRSIPEWAADVVAIVRRHRPAGPLVVGGFCSASCLAVEVARQLADRVRLVVLFEPDLPTWRSPRLAPLATLLQVPAAVLGEPAVARALEAAERHRLEGASGQLRALDLLRPLVVEHAHRALELPPGIDVPASARRAMASRREGLARLLMASYDHVGGAGAQPAHRGECVIFARGEGDPHELALQRDANAYWQTCDLLQGPTRCLELGPSDSGTRHPYLTLHHTILVHPVAMATVNDAVV